MLLTDQKLFMIKLLFKKKIFICGLFKHISLILPQSDTPQRSRKLKAMSPVPLNAADRSTRIRFPRILRGIIY